MRAAARAWAAVAASPLGNRARTQSRLIAECFRDAGLPDGVVNFVTGPGSTLGEALITSPEVDGITFTGSFDVGMHIGRLFAQGRYPRPTVLEMGGKNPSIVSRKADLDRAATGIMRSAFGLQGQKCSANSRIYVEQPVYDRFVGMLVERTRKLVVGDPTERSVYLGPVINENSYQQFQQFTLFDSLEFAPQKRVLKELNISVAGDFIGDTVTLDTFIQRFSQVPGPSTIILLGIGVAGLGLRLRRR